MFEEKEIVKHCCVCGKEFRGKDLTNGFVKGMFQCDVCQDVTLIIGPRPHNFVSSPPLKPALNPDG